MLPWQTCTRCPFPLPLTHDLTAMPFRIPSLLLTALLVLSGNLLSHTQAQVQTPDFRSDVSTEKKPWTSLDFYNNPRNFQFAIISDNSGGTRPGVFADGIRKLNLLMPEFVMSVGDFIEGNTNDRDRLAREWAVIDEEIKPLKVPFFFLPGNHDINNDVMRDVWNSRSGVPYYSFVYKDVLFLALDSTGEKGRIVPDHQVEYMKQALDRHQDVRWTFVFLHHPLWLYDDPAGFAKLQPLLQDRPHTVIAGHTHHYLHENRNGADYYILGTTGGGSRLRGRRFGEFDHVTWVTMSDSGPVIANVTLDGILPHDVTTRADYEITRALLQATQLPATVMTDHEETVTAADVALTLRNPSRQSLKVDAAFSHGHQLTISPDRINMTLPPRSEQVIHVAVEAAEPTAAKDPALLQLNWTMGFEIDGEEDLFLNGTRNIALKPAGAPLIGTVAPEFVGTLNVAPGETKPGQVLRFTTDGSTPTTDSPVFDDPLTINSPTTVKARRFNEQGLGTATSTASYRPVPPGTGLAYRYYEGVWTQMPDVSELKLKFEGVTSSLDVESLEMRPDYWCIVLEGDLQIDQEGDYTFHLNSDDGSLLYIDDKLVIDNDGDHSSLELSGSTRLTAGSHRLRLEFFESLGAAILELDMEGPGMPRQPIPFSRLSH